MKCPHCDAEIDDNAKFCDYCGKPIPVSAAAPAAEPAAVPFDAPEPEPSFAKSEPEQPQVYTPPAYTPQPQAYTPPVYTPQAQSYTPPVDAFPAAAGAKVLGFIPAETAGMVSLIIGGIGLLLSCTGCGGIIAIFGLIVGIMGLKTPDRQKSMIGLILSAVGILVSLVVACLVLIYFINGGGSSDYYY